MRKRLLDGQHCGQRFVLDVDQLGGGTRLIERPSRDGGDRLAFVLDKIGGQQRLIWTNGTDVVLAGNVGGRNRRDDAGRGERAGEIDAADTGMRMRAEHQRGFERAGYVRHIVDVERAAGDVADRTVVAHRTVHAATDAGERRVHKASTRVSISDDVSSCSRRTRLAAARSR